MVVVGFDCFKVLVVADGFHFGLFSIWKSVLLFKRMCLFRVWHVGIFLQQIYTVEWMVLWWKDVLPEEGLAFYNCCTSTDKWIHGPFLAGDQEKNREKRSALLNHEISIVTTLRCHPFCHSQKNLGASQILVFWYFWRSHLFCGSKVSNPSVPPRNYMIITCSRQTPGSRETGVFSGECGDLIAVPWNECCLGYQRRPSGDGRNAAPNGMYKTFLNHLNDG